MASFTAEKEAKVREAVLESIKSGSSRTAAASAAGICRKTLYRWMQDDEAYADEIIVAENKCIGQVEDALFRAATIPDEKGKFNTTAQIFFLCNRARDRWQNVKDIRHSGSIGTGNREAALKALASGGQALKAEEAGDGS